MDRYIVIEDRQGGEFGMYKDYTAEELKEQGQYWSDFADWYELSTKDVNGEELVAYVDDMWEITLVKVEPSNEVVKFLEDTIKAYDGERAEWAKRLLLEVNGKNE